RYLFISIPRPLDFTRNGSGANRARHRSWRRLAHESGAAAGSWPTSVPWQIRHRKNLGRHLQRAASAADRRRRSPDCKTLLENFAARTRLRWRQNDRNNVDPAFSWLSGGPVFYRAAIVRSPSCFAGLRPRSSLRRDVAILAV